MGRDTLTDEEYERFVKRRNKFLEKQKIRLDKLRKKRYNKEQRKEEYVRENG